MEFIPEDIMLIIFNYIPKITDKRQFIRTCAKYNNITKKLIEIAESNIIFKYPKFLKYTNKYSVEKFTYELCNDSYFNLMPISYLNPKNDIIMTILTLDGQDKLLKLAMKNGCELNKSNGKFNTCDFAACSGNLTILKLARLNGVGWQEKTFEIAAEYNHFHIIKYLKKYNCPWNTEPCEWAANNGNLEILKWLRKNNCPWNERICAWAASKGHLDVLIWARKHGCNWDKTTCTNAARNGHLNVLKWARKHGCDWDKTTCDNAKKNNHIHVYNWAKRHGCPE